MKKRAFAPLLVVASVGGLLLGQVPAVHAQLDKILKGGAVLAIVDKVGPDIDRFVNSITGNKPDDGNSTRVVPILTIGGGTYVGAVQVSGPKRLVDQVKAVAQIEGQTKILGTIRVRGLIPITNRNPRDLASLSRVKGVGVSATIEAKL